MARTAVWGLLGLWLGACAGMVYAESDPDGSRVQLVHQKLSLARKLLDRWEASGQADRPEARRMADSLDAAERALEMGVVDAAGDAVDVVLKRLARSASRTGCNRERRERLKERYRELSQGVSSFQQALARVAEEKNDPQLAVLEDVAVDEAMAWAQALAEAGLYEEANRELEPVYESVSRALARARANETIEHRLVFENAEEEYAYEQERYRSHLMLVELAFEKRPPDPWTRERVLERVAASKVLRKEADTQAQRGNHARALKTLEQATAGLVRAVRQAGLMIP